MTCFESPPGVSVVDILQRRRLPQFGFPEQALEPLVVAVGLFVLDQKPDEVGMGKLTMPGISQTLADAPGHTKQLE